VLPFFYLGGDVSVGLLNTVGDIGLVGESTSFGIRANASLDLRGLEQNIPFIARLNLQYWFDNSAALTNRVEQARYDALPTTGPDARRPMADETRHLLSRVERFALGINRTDFFNIAIGIELPFTVMTDFTISPIAEWQIGIPANRQGYNCLFVRPDFEAGIDDGCLDIQGVSAFPSTLTLGVRVMPPFRGLSLTAAVDIGTTGMSTFVRELAGNAPYDVILGFGYAFDAVPRVERVVEEVERRVEITIPPPVKGRLIGTVVEQGAGTPIDGARVTYVDRDLTPQSTGGDGRFASYDLDPGEVRVEITHPEYHAGGCSGVIPEEGGDVEIRCELNPLPRLGNVRGTVRNDTGGPVVGAQVTVTGPSPFSASTDAAGQFFREDLTPGTYTARVEGEGYLITLETFEVRPRETAEPAITVIARPRRALVSLRAREIIIRRQINFATDSAEILPDSTALLTEIADTMLRHPEIRRVEIQGHTDSNGDNDHNLDLSQRRADSVRTWLIGAGVEGTRLEARGYGETRPLVPNITAANRARNRRVQFMIQERDTP
jgi:outer membrane protein OmpA-like peptidoglycan-associated protein